MAVLWRARIGVNRDRVLLSAIEKGDADGSKDLYFVQV